MKPPLELSQIIQEEIEPLMSPVPQQIKNVYYDLAKIHHPDTHKEQINIENSETVDNIYNIYIYI